MKKLLLSLLLTGSSLLALARDPHVRIVESLPGERWWGGFVALGNRMPFGEELAEQDLSKSNYNNQSVPLLLSSEGRYVWSERPFRFRIEEGNLVVDSDYRSGRGCTGRRESARRLCGGLRGPLPAFGTDSPGALLLDAPVQHLDRAHL